MYEYPAHGGQKNIYSRWSSAAEVVEGGDCRERHDVSKSVRSIGRVEGGRQGGGMGKLVDGRAATDRCL